LAAMLPPERLRQQLSRHSDPVESCYLPFQTANTNEGGVEVFVKSAICQHGCFCGPTLE
jgi:hypothetical protein